MRVRLLLTKKDDLIFLSHLEWMKFLERLFVMAQWPMLYSQGFNPHVLMSFALPLPVGIASERCYMDLEIEDIELEDLQDIQPIQGLSILDRKITEDKALMGVVGSASYRLKGPVDQIWDGLQQEELPFVKRSKKGPRAIDAKQYLLNYQREADDLLITLKAGSRENLKPTDLLAALLHDQDQVHDWDILRLDVYDLEGRSLWQR